MSVDNIVEILNEDDEVQESYVLLREMKMFLDVGHPHFNPEIRVKIYKSTVTPQTPYH